VAYPNVLVMGYLRTGGTLTPDKALKLQAFIATGTQKMLTFLAADGGFNWYAKNREGNPRLTAYGLLLLSDTAKVHDVDPRLIDGLRQYLIRRQNPDGSWDLDSTYGRGGAQERDALGTAYAALALAESGAGGAAVARALRFVADQDVRDSPVLVAYQALAILADPKGPGAGPLAERLAAMAAVEGEKAHWPSAGAGMFGSRGDTGDVEATALAVQVLLKARARLDLARKGMTWLISRKDPQGFWGTTQATVQALKALVLAAGAMAASGEPLEVSVFLDGEKRDTKRFAPDTSDVMQTFVAKDELAPGTHRVRIEATKASGLAYQVVARRHVPAPKDEGPRAKPVEIRVEYDRTALEVGGVMKGVATVSYNLDQAAFMVIVDLGIPPGFDAMAEDFEKLVESKAIDRYSLAPRQATLYLGWMEKGKPARFEFRLVARTPVRAAIPPSRVWEYYNPDRKDQTAGERVEVK
jgi:uncharacterized protein YfaS (alpha-2-macroglobulin family)